MPDLAENEATIRDRVADDLETVAPILTNAVEILRDIDVDAASEILAALIPLARTHRRLVDTDHESATTRDDARRLIANRIRDWYSSPALRSPDTAAADIMLELEERHLALFAEEVPGR